jgi:hypothetical protein
VAWRGAYLVDLWRSLRRNYVLGHLVGRSDNSEEAEESHNSLRPALNVYSTVVELATVPTKFPATVDQRAIGEVASYKVAVVHDHSLAVFSFIVDRLHDSSMAEASRFFFRFSQLSCGWFWS